MESSILLFDGVCNLCNGVVQFIIRHDRKKKIKFAPLQSESGQQLLKKFSLPLNDFDSFVFIHENNYWTKSSAGLKVLNELGAGWKIFYPLIFIPKFIRDFFYSIVAKTRYKIFGRKKVCMIPTPEIRERFLE